MIIITPGPILSIWKDGKLMAQEALTPQAALNLVKDVVKEIRL